MKEGKMKLLGLVTVAFVEGVVFGMHFANTGDWTAFAAIGIFALMACVIGLVKYREDGAL